ncbi:hypothetical protein [Streptomyces sp. NPDC097619]|uniref:hypothetical protein n=1 Tax=Streptomyces sp. NPDC097619 TaxID=3157228 RepID=UPI00332769EF
MDGARDVAVAFGHALKSTDWTRACALLAPETRKQLEDDAFRPCGAALGGEGLPGTGRIRSAQVHGRQALVRATGDALFLSRFDDGWKVVAAGCEPGAAADLPYRCTLEGG